MCHRAAFVGSTCTSRPDHSSECKCLRAKLSGPRPFKKMSATYRCSKCKCIGHDRRRCPYSDEEAYTRTRRWWVEEFRRRADLRATAGELYRLQIENARLRGEIQTLVPVLPGVNEFYECERTGPCGPTKSQIKLQEIIFDNSDKMPEGLYKDLMDALVLK